MNSFNIIEHMDVEENLRAAKEALKTDRKAYLQRRTGTEDDVIDIISDCRIIERHICYHAYSISIIPRKEHLNVEELALYQ